MPFSTIPYGMRSTSLANKIFPEWKIWTKNSVNSIPLHSGSIENQPQINCIICQYDHCLHPRTESLNKKRKWKGEYPIIHFFYSKPKPAFQPRWHLGVMPYFFHFGYTYQIHALRCICTCRVPSSLIFPIRLTFHGFWFPNHSWVILNPVYSWSSSYKMFMHADC
jgi:hypothetical protein